ncbi:MAG: hypothetical protein Q8Q04_03695 [archaeon]|nr:hypothetical protein [archaeon]
MRKEGRIVFGLLFLSALILILFSPSVSAVECSGGQQANYLGCSGEYTISQQSTGSCWYHDPYYSYWPNGTIRSIWNYKAQGISNGIYCWEYGTSAQCWSEEEYCEWYVGGQYTTLYDCSEIPTESGCLSLESGGCTAEYSCECPSGTNLQVVGEEFAHCLGTYDVTYTNPAYCSWRGVGCAGSSPEQCEANSYCTWTGKCFSSVSNTCDGHSNQGSCNSDSNCNWIPEQTITGPFGLCYSSYPTESQCLSHQVDGCNAVYDNVYQCTADPHCSDSDGSPTNYNTRGFIHSNNGAILNGYNEYNGHASDFCFESAGDPYVPVPSGDGLQEYGCSGTTSVLNSSGGCSYGCTGGKCNPAPPTCSDSDGGLVYNVL